MNIFLAGLRIFLIVLIATPFFAIGGLWWVIKDAFGLGQEAAEDTTRSSFKAVIDRLEKP